MVLFLLEALLDFFVEDEVVFLVFAFEDEWAFLALVVVSFFWPLLVASVGCPCPNKISLPLRVRVNTNLRIVFPRRKLREKFIKTRIEIRYSGISLGPAETNGKNPVRRE